MTQSEMFEPFQFGYPECCADCGDLSINRSERVSPYFQKGNEFKLMIIGQDPTIFTRPQRVRHVLMLDDKNGQLSRWLRELIGSDVYNSITIYATNIVKCTFNKPPSASQEGGLNVLRPFFSNCKKYIEKELVLFSPTCVLALGEPTHKLFSSILEFRPPDTMQKAFTGEMFKAKYKGLEFDYSPCLHIKTFRVAETYGKSVAIFKNSIKDYFPNRIHKK